MGDAFPRFEVDDNEGHTEQFSGTVGTTPIVLPDPATTPISEFFVECPEDQSDANRLFVSIDGTTFHTLYPSGYWAWTPKNDTVKQITLKGNVAGVEYAVTINREAD